MINNLNVDKQLIQMLKQLSQQNYNKIESKFDKFIQEYQILSKNIARINKHIVRQYCQYYCLPYDLNQDVEFQNQFDQKTVALWLASQGIIPPQKFQHNPTICDKNKSTVAMHLASYGIIPPNQWQHDPQLKNINNETVAHWLAYNGITPPTQWEIDCKQQISKKQIMRRINSSNSSQYKQYQLLNNKNGYTVAMLLIEHGVLPTQNWIYNQQITSTNKSTMIKLLKQQCYPVSQLCYSFENETIKADIFEQAIFRKIPDITGHQSDEQNKDGFTVAMILAINNIEIPEQWYHNPEIQNKYGYTVALYQARNGHIPDQQWEHNKLLRAKYCISKEENEFRFYTVQNFFENKQLQVPNQWKYVPLNQIEDNQAMIQADKKIAPTQTSQQIKYQNKYGWTVAMKIARQGEIPNIFWHHNPNLENRWNETVAMILADEGKIPPQEWYHDPKLQDKNHFTVALYLASKGVIPPKQWQHNPLLQTESGQTVALLLAANKQIPPQQWLHQPQLQDEYGFTVAMNLAKQNIIAPEEWQHNPYLQNNMGQTVAHILASNGVVPPKIWEHQSELQDEKGNTVAMLLADKGIIPPEQWHHNPELVNKIGETVALKLIKSNKNPTKEWIHRPNLFYKIYDENDETKLQYDMTIAMLFATQRKICPQEWNHDKLLVDKINGQTVGMILSSVGIIPPQQWMHDIAIVDQHQNTIKTYLQNNGYLYKNMQFIPNCQTYRSQETCQLCFEPNKQIFVKSLCGDRICLDCFIKLLQEQNVKRCSICKQRNWFYKLDDQQEQISISSLSCNTSRKTTESIDYSDLSDLSYSSEFCDI